MDAYRELIAGTKLAEVMNLPEELNASELEAFILPIKKEEKQIEEIQPINLDDLLQHKLGIELSPKDTDDADCF